MNEVTNPSENMKVVEETPTQQSELTNRQKAEIAIKEIREKYGLSEFHIGEALSKKVKEQADLFKNEAEMYAKEMQRMSNKVQYKELVAREINAQLVIDKHAQEMQQYEKGVIDTVIEWLRLNAPEQAKDMIAIMCEEMNIPYDKIRAKLDSRIQTEVLKRSKDTVDMERKVFQAEMKQFASVLEKASKKQRRIICEKYID